MTKRITIIGAGISGLYIAYILLKRLQIDVKVTIIEKNNYIGGRIFTHREHIEQQSVHFDCGAGRLGSRDAQPYLWNLLDLLELTNKIKQISTTQEQRNQFYDVLHRLEQFSDEQLMTSTVEQLIGAVDPNIFGYDAEFKCMNAFYVKSYILRHFVGDHYYLDGGLDQIVKTLVNNLQSNVRFMLNSSVFELNQTYCRLRNGKLIKHDHVYVTIPPRYYLQLRFPTILKDVIYNLNASVEPVALCRLFVGIRNFNRCESPFGNIGRLTHTGPIRMFFTMNTYTTFTVCQVYTDSLWAKWWNEQIHSKRTDVITSELQKLFPNVQHKFVCMYHKIAFWKNGVHVWKPNWRNDSIDIKPFSWISICGESTSKTSQGWIEGSLESVESLF
jgi:hypothetical protein